jgi:hypothetical protein
MYKYEWFNLKIYKSSYDSNKCAIPTAKKALDNIFSQCLSRKINLWMPQYFAKVSPRDPSCAAWHRLW